MKKIITFLMCVTPYVLFAQNTINHNVVYDNPNKENLAISVDYFIAEFYTGAEDEKGVDGYAGLGYGIQASYMNLFNRMQIEASIRKNYKLDHYSSNYLDAGITWDISQKSKNKTTSFTLDYAGNNKVNVMYPKLKQMNRIRVRAGVSRTKTYIPMFNIDRQLLGSGLTMETQVSNMGLYGGLEFAMNNCFKTSVSGFKDKRDKTSIRIFADVMGTTLNYTGMYSRSIRGGTEEEPQTRHIEQFDSIGIATQLGFRVGAKYIHSYPNGVALNVDMNFGQRPPYLGIYGYLGTGITINIATAFQGESDVKLED